ncbi:hypothetical protein BH11BAC1_BH11BAC1_19320 [soil metagenome]
MTGTIINVVGRVGGIEYSRNRDFLYVSNYDPNGTLVQYDLTMGNAATIISSKTILSSTPKEIVLHEGIYFDTISGDKVVAKKFICVR